MICLTSGEQKHVHRYVQFQKHTHTDERLFFQDCSLHYGTPINSKCKSEFQWINVKTHDLDNDMWDFFFLFLRRIRMCIALYHTTPLDYCNKRICKTNDIKSIQQCPGHVEEVPSNMSYSLYNDEVILPRPNLPQQWIPVLGSRVCTIQWTKPGFIGFFSEFFCFLNFMSQNPRSLSYHVINLIFRLEYFRTEKLR